MARRFLGDFEVTNNVLIGNTLTLSALTASRALEIDGSGNVVSSSVTSTEMGYLAGVTSDIQTQLNAKQNTSEKGNANGYASLDGGGKIPAAQLPNSVMEFQGAWNASTNSPTLADGSGNAGDVYRASVAGSSDLGSGSQTWSIGDLVMYSGSIWEKAPASDAVSSVFGRTGAVAAAASDYDAVQIDYDNSSSSLTATDVQAAIDEVESRLDSAESNITANDGDITDIRSAVGIADGATDMGTFTGSTISDNVSAKAGMQELETSLELKADSSVVTEIDANVDDLITLSGVAENSTDLGTFTGSTIADSSTNKAALQALETEVELKAASTDLASTANSLGASLIGIEDAAANFTATNLEAVLAELQGNIDAGTDDQTAAEVSFDPGNPSANLLTNGDFETGDLTGWTDASQGSGSISVNGSNQVVTTVISAGNSGRVEQAVSGLTIGQSYTVEYEVVNGGAGGTNDRVQIVGGVSQDNQGVGTHTLGFTATATSHTFRMGNSASTPGDIIYDNISFKSDAASSGYDPASTDVQKALDESANRMADEEAESVALRSSQGTSTGDTDMGTFTGSTISDAGSVKAGMQELETEVELKAASSDLASNANALGASLIGIEDASSQFTATDVEGALDEALDAAQAAQSDIDDHKDGTASKHDATEVDYERVDGSKTDIQAASDDVEAALSDLDDNKAGFTQLASAANGDGASLIGIEDSAGDFTATDVEGALAELFSAISAGTDDQIASEVPFTPGVNPNPELMVNGDFETGDLTGWTDDSIGSGSISVNGSNQLVTTVVSGGNRGDASQTRTGLTIGASYDLVYEIVSGGDGGDNDRVNIDGGIGATFNQGVGTHTITFTATATSHKFSFLNEDGDPGDIIYDNISLKLTNAGGLVATDVQAAIDELEPRVTSLEQISAEGDLMIGDGSGDPSQLSIGAADTVLTSDGSTASWEIIGSPGDIKETSFSGANNQAAAANVTGLAFAAGVVRSFRVHGSIVIDATADLYEEFELYGIQRGSDFQIDDMRTGDNSGVVFSITSAGQVQYTSPNSAGFVSLDIKFRAITTSV